MRPAAGLVGTVGLRLTWLAATMLLASCGTRLPDAAQVSAPPGPAPTAAPAPAISSSGSEVAPAGPTGESPVSSAPVTSSGAPGPTAAGGATGGEGRARAPQPAAGDAQARKAGPGAPAVAPMEPAPGSGPGASPAVVASVGTYSGPAGTILLPILQGAQLWVKYVNDRGGLNHHPVKLLAYDDGGDPSRHRAQVQEAIERQHAIAFLANAEGFTGQSSVSYITSKRVPVIPDVGGGHYYDSPMYFPASPSGLIFVYATLEALAHRWVPAGKTKLGLAYCVEAPSCTESQKLYQRWAGPLGLDLVYQTGVSLAQPDYTAECLAARSAGAEILSTFVDQSSVTRFAANCARQGYHPIFSVPGTVMDLAWKDNPHLDNFTSGSGTFLWFQSGTPATDEFQHALRTYGSKVPRTVAVTNGWVAGKLLERAAAALPEPPTSEALLQGLWAIKNDDLGGLTYPLTFVENQPAKPVACWFNLVIEKRSWVSPDGFRLNCSANRLNSRGLPPSG